jgi:hypothetical protein
MIVGVRDRDLNPASPECEAGLLNVSAATFGSLFNDTVSTVEII